MGNKSFGKGMENDESQNPYLTYAKKYACLIKFKDNNGTGFSCNIPGLGDDVPFTFLITNNHIYPHASNFIEIFIDIIIKGDPKRIDLE